MKGEPYGNMPKDSSFSFTLQRAVDSSPSFSSRCSALPSLCNNRKNTFIYPGHRLAVFLIRVLLGIFLLSKSMYRPTLYVSVASNKESFPNGLNMAHNLRKFFLKSSSDCFLVIVLVEYCSPIRRQ